MMEKPDTTLPVQIIAEEDDKLDQASHEHHHLFFVRHGERADHAPHLKIEYPNRYDPPLTPLGVQQALETGAFF
jgi:hypothetical protein